MYIMNFKMKKDVIEYMNENEDFIIPMMYDCIGKNLLKNNMKLLVMVINNILKTDFKEEEIIMKDGRCEKQNLKEKQRERDVYVEIRNSCINIELNSGIKRTKATDEKNLSYLGNMLRMDAEKEIYQINLNRYDIFQKGKEVYISTLKTEEGYERIENIKIYDVSIGNFKKKCYTNGRRYEEDFLLLMEIFEMESKEKIRSKIREKEFLMEVYEMQERLSGEEEVRAKFSDEYYKEKEHKEIMEYYGGKIGELEVKEKELDAKNQELDAKEQKLKEEKRLLEEEKQTAKKEKNVDIAKKMLKKGYDIEDIMEITGLSKDQIQVNK